jgi:hypothetical protein
VSSELIRRHEIARIDAFPFQSRMHYIAEQSCMSPASCRVPEGETF